MKQLSYKQIKLPLGLAIGLLVSLGDRAIFAVALGRSLELSGEIDSIVSNALAVAIPFLVLAFRSSSRVASWVIAFALTAMVHGWWLSKGIAYQQSPDGSGVDMSGAFLMMASSAADNDRRGCFGQHVSTA